MFPSAATALGDLRLDCTHKEIFSSFLKMTRSQFPGNVITEVNPFLWEPSNLPEGWYFIPSEENKDTNNFGFWKAKGEACKIYSNSVITGWSTTFEFFEDHTYGHKTDWMIQEYRMVQGKPYESNKAQEVSSLCRLFRGCKQSQNCEKQQKPAGTDIASENRIHPTKSVVADNFIGKGSTSKPQVSADNNTSRLNLADTFPDHWPDYPSRDDGLGLWELDNPALSSSSENSGCTSMSSDAYFDSEAFLKILEEPVKNQEDVDFKLSVSASAKADEGFISLPTSGSLVRSGRKTLAPEEIIKTDCSIPKSAARGRVLDSNNLKHASRNLRTNIRNEGPSSSSHNVSQSSKTRPAAPNGEKAAAARKKRFKKYLCFFM
ncbi:hypothetical protein F2P56_012573 [Juglans regia]|uniref:NAC domain-containing protein 79-like n=2 Tax=Juglans regia TaxID=51240 RepID=A0A2I4HGV8_JUGRE|nr:NAC domain-containing protein 79-like [Juglans regia]KAF5468421.1 hypothetical protein F2P56_012573 [Juglans regia]